MPFGIVFHSCAAFVLALLFLVFIHEYGHFIIARVCGVKVEKFAIGFGPALFRKRFKSKLEFVLGCLPLGGYIKMLDSTEDHVAIEDLPFAFDQQSILKRLAIVLAGPLFNLIGAFFVFWLMFLLGVTQVLPLIGQMDAGSVAERIGLQTGDRIVAVNGVPTFSWQEVRLVLLSHLGESKIMTIETMSSKNQQRSLFSFNNTELKISANDPQPLKALGVHSLNPEIPAQVGFISSGSPAEQSGLKVGDIILRINHHPVKDWNHLSNYIRVRPSQELHLKILRGDKTRMVDVIPHTEVSPTGETIGVMGIRSAPVRWSESQLYRQHYSLFSAMVKAVEYTCHMVVFNLKMMWKLASGVLGWHNIAGPVGLTMSAGIALNIGWTEFLNFVGIISISLALLNVLPIPILDGGHALMLCFEALRGRAVSLKMQSVLLRFGFVLLICLTVLALYNDILRL